MRELEFVYDYASAARDVLRWPQSPCINQHPTILEADLSAISGLYDVAGGVRFAGLTRSWSEDTYLDGTPSYVYGLPAVVSVIALPTPLDLEFGVLGHEGKAAYHSELWVRRGTACVCAIAQCVVALLESRCTKYGKNSGTGIPDLIPDFWL